MAVQRQRLAFGGVEMMGRSRLRSLSCRNSLSITSLVALCSLAVAAPASSEEALTSSIEARIARSLSPSQLESYASGVDPRSIPLTLGTTLDDHIQRVLLGTDFEVSWHSIDGGGGVSRGGALEVAGSAGQVDARVLVGGDFRWTGGFFSAASPSGCGSTPTIHCDGFETGDLSRWGFIEP